MYQKLIALLFSSLKWCLPWVAKYVQARLSLKDTLHRASMVSALLGELRVIAKADRVVIYSLHNGGHFTTNVPRFYVAATHEALGPGVRPAPHDPVLASRLLPLISRLDNTTNDRRCCECKLTCPAPIFVQDVDEMDNSYSKALLESRGVSKFVERALKGKDGGLVGFVLVEWVELDRHSDGEVFVEQYLVDICEMTTRIELALQN